MRRTDHKQNALFGYVNIDGRIAVEHPLVRVKVLADLVLCVMPPIFDSLYAESGCPLSYEYVQYVY